MSSAYMVSTVSSADKLGPLQPSPWTPEAGAWTTSALSRLWRSLKYMAAVYSDGFGDLNFYLTGAVR